MQRPSHTLSPNLWTIFRSVAFVTAVAASALPVSGAGTATVIGHDGFVQAMATAFYRPPIV